MAPPLALVCHPGSDSRAVRNVQVGVDRRAEGVLAVAYSLAGDLGRVRIPPPRRPRIAERLWEHTCCEVFIAHADRPEYHEFNLSPSGEWAAYAFTGYREGGPLPDEALDPRITAHATADALVLGAAIPLARLAPALARARLRVGLSVVVEDDAGVLAYWALRHPPGKPDFHHPDAFTVALDEVRD